MKFKTLLIQGFRSFNEQQCLDFSSMAPGLYHITGKNLLEPGLGANAIGKSSLFEAVDWALTGKTSRGLRAGNIRNWLAGADKCEVILDGETASGSIAVLRSWQPNKLEVALGDSDPKPVDQPTLDSVMGIPMTVLRYAIHFAQFAPAFVDLDAPQQTTIFSSLLDLKVWEDAAQAAASAEKDVEQALTELRLDEATIKGKLETLASTNYGELEQLWEHDKTGRVRQIQNDLARLVKGIAEERARLVRTSESEGGGVEQSELESLVAKRGEVAAAIRDTNSTIALLQSKNYNACPTCGAPCDPKHVQKELTVQHRKVKQLADRLVDISTKIDDYRARIATAQSGLKKLEEEKQALSRLESDAKAKRTYLAKVGQEINPYTKLREDADAQGGVLVAKLEQIEADIADAGQELAAVRFWTKGFKDIRLAQVEASLRQLEVESNEALYQLGLHDWALDFSIDKQLKSGGSSRAFTIMVRSPHTEQPVPWEVWSGGESQRLRLAVSMGFANLVCARLGVQPNIELWDEPSSWLGESGIHDMLDVLADRAERLGKIILLADHRALDFGRFTDTIYITKDETGSKISNQPPV